MSRLDARAIALNLVTIELNGHLDSALAGLGLSSERQTMGFSDIAIELTRLFAEYVNLSVVGCSPRQAFQAFVERVEQDDEQDDSS